MPDIDVERELKQIASTLHDRHERLEDKFDEIEVKLQAAAMLPAGSRSRLDAADPADLGPFIGLERKMAPFFAVGQTDYEAKNVRTGALLAALAGGKNVVDQLRPDEAKAFNSLRGPAGDFVVPTAIGSIFIDAVRPKMRVMQAGARTYAMESQRVTLPGWKTPPTAFWRSELGDYEDGGGEFREVALQARGVGCYLDISNDVLEDAAENLDGVAMLIEDEAAKAIAQAIDKAALFGAGGVEPQGLAQVEANVITALEGVQQISLGNNGGTPSWDTVIDAVAAVRAQNFEPTAALWASRTDQTLAKIKASGSGEYLDPPKYLDNLLRLDTNQIGTAYEKGSSGDTSALFVGDWSRMVIGTRAESTVRVLRDPYTRAKQGETRMFFWQRVDIVQLNRPAFVVVDGVRP